MNLPVELINKLVSRLRTCHKILAKQVLQQSGEHFELVLEIEKTLKEFDNHRHSVEYPVHAIRANRIDKDWCINTKFMYQEFKGNTPITPIRETDDCGNWTWYEVGQFLGGN